MQQEFEILSASLGGVCKQTLLDGVALAGGKLKALGIQVWEYRFFSDWTLIHILKNTLKKWRNNRAVQSENGEAFPEMLSKKEERNNL